MAVIRALNVAEKPSVAKAVSQILSRGQYRTREGLSVYNKIFEFGYTVGNQQVSEGIMSEVGHCFADQRSTFASNYAAMGSIGLLCCLSEAVRNLSNRNDALTTHVKACHLAQLLESQLSTRTILTSCLARWTCS